MSNTFFHHLLHYIVEIAPSLALGFFLSGLIHEFVPSRFVEKHLSGNGILPLLYSAFIGTILPICCIGSLPVALSLHRKGASTGAVVAFLVATPATSISALLVSLKMLGIPFTIYIFFAVIFMGVALGSIGNLFNFKPRKFDFNESSNKSCRDNSCETGSQKNKENDEEYCESCNNDKATDPICGMSVEKNDKSISAEHEGGKYYFCSNHCLETFMNNPDRYAISGRPNLGRRIVEVLRFAFITMPKDIGVELIIGILLAALIASFDPIGQFIKSYLAGWLAYPIGLLFGLVMYICSTASVPLVSALIDNGMNIGAGMVLLIAGPVTSWGTILVLKTHYGLKMLIFYLVGVSFFSVIFGVIYSIL